MLFQVSVIAKPRQARPWTEISRRSAARNIYIYNFGRLSVMCHIALDPNRSTQMHSIDTYLYKENIRVYIYIYVCVCVCACV